MPAQPILELFTRLNRSPEDTVVLGHFPSDGHWQNAVAPLRLADLIAQGLTAQQHNVYVMVNPTRPITGNRRGSIGDVTRLAALWADLDVKPSGVENMTVADQIIADLSDLLNSPPVAIVHSGHGLQPYWEFDAEDGVIEGDPLPMARLLRRWGVLVTRIAGHYNAGVDSVYDLPRVLRAPGTINYKELPVPTSIQYPEGSSPIGINQLTDLLDEWGITDEQVVHLDRGEREVQQPIEAWPIANEDCNWAVSALADAENASWGARHPTAVAKAIQFAAYARRGCWTKEGYLAGVERLEAKFLHELSQGDGKRDPVRGEFQQIMRHAINYVAGMTLGEVTMETNNHHHGDDQVGETPGSGGEVPVDQPEATPAETVLGRPILRSPVHTESWNSEILEQELSGQFIHVPKMGWFYWDGTRYAEDEAGVIILAAQEALRSISAYAPGAGSLAWWKKSMNRGVLRSSVDLAAPRPAISVHHDMLDSAAYDLVTPGGIVDLRSGELREADPRKDFNTKSTAITPARGPHPMWDKFLLTILEHQDKVDYVQGLLGIALVGKTIVQAVPLFSGTGANGKSTTTELVSRILDSYAVALPENFFLEQRQQEHSTELAGLQGARFATASETKPNGVFNESRLKALSGGDRIRARKMREDFIDFVPTHMSFINLNHKPQIRAGGDSFFRRIKVVNFGYQVPEADRNPMLGDELYAAEGPQIFQWLIDGCVRVLKEGLYEPSVITLDTKNYQSEEDKMHQFIQENVLEVPGNGIPRDTLYQRYLGFASKERLDEQLTSQQFLREFLARVGSAASYTERGVRMVRNISLTETEQFSGTGTGLGSPGYEPRTFTDE